MATIRKKVYKKNVSGGAISTTLTELNTSQVDNEGFETDEFIYGSPDPEYIRAIPKGQYATTQDLLHLTEDLVYNDTVIDNEKNAINELVNEGVLKLNDYQFFQAINTINFAVEANSDWDTVAEAMEVALQELTGGEETVEIIDSTIKVSSATTGTTSTVLIQQTAEINVNHIDFIATLEDDDIIPGINPVLDTPVAGDGTPSSGYATISDDDGTGVTFTGSSNSNLPAGVYDLDIIIDDLNKAIISSGKLKILNDNISNVFDVAEETQFDISTIANENWYRRDLIVCVYYDEANSSSVPYLEYINGNESKLVPYPHTLDDASYTSAKAYYPLWSYLFQNESGSTIWQSTTQVFKYAGFKEIIHLVEESLQDRLVKVTTNPYYNESYYGVKSDNVTLTDSYGNILVPESGQSSLELDYEGASNPEGSFRQAYAQLQTPDVQFIEKLYEGGDLLTFPFKLNIDVDQYYPRESIEMREIKIAIAQNTVATAVAEYEEGIEATIYTAEYYVNSESNSVFPVTSYSCPADEATIVLSEDVTVLAKTSFNHDSFTDLTTPGVIADLDFIYVIDGTGLDQIVKITEAAEGYIKTAALSVALDSTSKIIIFKGSTIDLCGDTLDSTFLATLTDEESADYEDTYRYSTHSGTGTLVWDAENDYSEAPYTVTDEKQVSLTTTTLKVNRIPTTITGIYLSSDIGQTETNYADSYTLDINTRIITLTGDALDYANSEVVVTYTARTPDLKYYHDEDDYNDTDEDRLFGAGSGYPFAKIPFKLRLNFDQFYFARLSITDRNIPYSGYGVKPRVVVTDPTTLIDETDNVVAYARGSKDLSLGHDWFGSGNNEGFTFNYGGGEDAEIIFDEDTTSAAGVGYATPAERIDAIVSIINDQIALLTPTYNTGMILAVNRDDKYIDFETADPGPDETFELKITPGVTSALLTLGWSIGTYTGSEASISPFFEVSCLTDPGLYPIVTTNNVTLQLTDGYGDLQDYKPERIGISLPPYYKVIAKNLNSNFFSKPLHRITELGGLESDPGTCYLDTYNGLISFAEDEEPVSLKISCYYPIIFTGAVNWDDIVNRPPTVVDISEEIFTATAGQTEFILSKEPVTAESLLVAVDGVYQTKNDYTLIGQTVTLSPTDAGDVVSFKFLALGQLSIPLDGSITAEKIADGAVTDDALNQIKMYRFDSSVTEDRDVATGELVLSMGEFSINTGVTIDIQGDSVWKII